MALSEILTTINLKYLYEALHLQSLVQLYHKFLNRTNIMQLVVQINKPGYEKLDFLLPKKGELSYIPKTIVFTDSIDKKIALEKYLQSHLLEKFKNWGNKIIMSFLLDLESKTKTI